MNINAGTGCSLDWISINCGALLQAIGAGITNVNPTTLSTVGGTATFQIPGGCVSVNGGPATCDQPQSVTISVPGCGFFCQAFNAVVNFIAPPLPSNVRVGIVPLGFGGLGAATETTTIYRAVSQAELADIEAAGAYNPSPFGGEVKYFYPTAERLTSSFSGAGPRP